MYLFFTFIMLTHFLISCSHEQLHLSSNNVIVLKDAVDDASVSDVIYKLNKMNRHFDTKN